MGGLWHLTKRFLGAVKPGAPPQSDERWARQHLLAGELEVWQLMNNPDRRHAIEVARAVVADPRLGPDASVDRPIVAAALLHDSGKVLCNFRTPSRVAATVLWSVTSEKTAARWLSDYDRGYRHRMAQYRRHPQLGSEMLEAAGSDPLTFRWAAEHHLGERDWTVPAHVGRVLKDCDDD